MGRSWPQGPSQVQRSFLEDKEDDSKHTWWVLERWAGRRGLGMGLRWTRCWENGRFGVFTCLSPTSKGDVRVVALRMGSQEETYSKPVLLSKKLTVSHVIPSQTDNCSPSPISQPAQVLQTANQTNTSAKPTRNLKVDVCQQFQQRSHHKLCNDFLQLLLQPLNTPWATLQILIMPFWGVYFANRNPQASCKSPNTCMSNCTR